jgi:hypothetical protein
MSAKAQEIAFNTQPKSDQKVKVTDARILYTGRLMGYFRLPTLQKPSDRECPSTLAEASEDVPDFLKQAVKDGNTILVGTGDNFAPELFARIFDLPPDVNRRHKDRYTWDWLDQKGPHWVKNEDVKLESLLANEIKSGHGRIPTDNVACFLSHAGYDAIVPGKHDFHFGPERLRYLARLLASLNTKQGDLAYQPVQVLAANLMIETKYFKGEKAVADTYRGVKYLTPSEKVELKRDGWGSSKPSDLADKDSVLPWLRTVTVKVDTSVFDSSGNPNFSNVVEAQLVSGDAMDPYKLGTEKVRLPEKQCAKVGTHVYELPEEKLKGGENYFFCLKRTDKTDSLPYCIRFAVYSPFFTYKSEDWRSDDPKHPNEPNAYLYRQLNNGTDVAIFGIIDPALREHVGQLNFSWNNPNKKYETEILVIDPVIALKQLLQKFQEDNEKARRKFKGIKILLTQMSAPQAKQLSVQLAGEFDVVVSQGQLEYATPNQNLRIDLTDIKYDKESTRDGLRPSKPTFVAVPPPYFNPASKKRAIRVRELRVINHPTTKNVWEFNVKEPCTLVRKTGQTDVMECPKPTVHPPAQQCPAFDNLVCAAVANLLRGNHGGHQENLEAFQDLTLHAMLKSLNADVAMIQKRDFFWPLPEDACNSRNLQDQLDRVLWKGDFLMRRQIPGSTLKRLLARSKQFNDDDESSVSLEIEKGRGLVTLGVTYDSRLDEYFINGSPLDTGRLYTVATTDYIGLGDTGYPELTDAAVGDPKRPRDFHRLDYISGLICEEMRDDESLVCEASLDGEPYFDRLAQLPGDRRPRKGYLARMKEWAFSGKDPSRTQQPAPTLRDLFQQKQQDRTTLTVSLEKASIGFSGIRHRFSEKDRADLFAGIPIPELGAKRSHSWSFEHGMRVTFGGKWLDEYLAEELSYNTEATRQESGPTIVSQSQNTFASETGIFLHRTKELPRVGLLTAARYETQFAPPITTFKLETGGDLTTDALGRSHKLLFKLGPRVENRKSSIEGGYQFGHQFNAITAFIFDPGDIKCSLGDTKQTVQQCIKSNSNPAAPFIAVRAEREGRFQHGLFLNFKLVVPFHPKVSYTIENKGEFFFTRQPIDNSTDTRYQDVLEQTVSIPLFDNLFFEPKLRLFWYQNKVDRNSFWQRQYGLTINYKFDWYKGNRLRDAITYKRP